MAWSMADFRCSLSPDHCAEHNQYNDHLEKQTQVYLLPALNLVKWLVCTKQLHGYSPQGAIGIDPSTAKFFPFLESSVIPVMKKVEIASSTSM